MSDLQTQYNKLKQDYDELKEENDELKEENRQLHQFHEWDKIGTLKWNEAKDENEKLKKKIEELIEENKNLTCISVANEHRIQLQEKQFSQFIPMFEYADKLWRETEYPQLPKICLREPHEIVSMLKCLSEENKEVMKENEEVMKENEELKTDIEKLKEPVINDRDARCPQLDIRVGYSYVSQCIDGVLPALECDEIDVDNLPDVVYNEVAKTIESAINSFMFRPTAANQDIDGYIYDEVYEKVEELKEQGLFKEEE